MIHTSKHTDERRECGAIECWLLHGAVGSVADWRSFSSAMSKRKIGTRAVDLWRFLDCAPMSLETFGNSLNAEAAGVSSRNPRVLIGYSMGGRLALHGLLQEAHPWTAAVIISAHPGLESEAERAARRARDSEWASRALTDTWASFLDDWHNQPVLDGGEIRDRQADSRLAMRRCEIARSFMDWSLGTQEPLWERLREIRIPVLWVAGENDPVYADLARHAAAQTERGRAVIAPACGHRVPWQNESWLVDQVAGFLA